MTDPERSPEVGPVEPGFGMCPSAGIWNLKNTDKASMHRARVLSSDSCSYFFSFAESFSAVIC